MSGDPKSRERLLRAAIDVIRSKGYGATRVDDIAAAAGLTKGSFFHHFASKEACARAAVGFWNAEARASFEGSALGDARRPAARVLAYVDARIARLGGQVAGYACYVGTVLQEVHDTHPDLAAESAASILEQAALLEEDLAAALGGDHAEAHDLAIHIEASIQGALLIAKAQGGSHGARTSLEHLRRYLESRLEE